MVAWRFTDFFPARVLAIAWCVFPLLRLLLPDRSLLSVCTPYQAPAKASMPAISDEDLIRKYLPNFGYQLYFVKEEAVEEMGEVR
mgnify:FL=1